MSNGEICHISFMMPTNKRIKDILSTQCKSESFRNSKNGDTTTSTYQTLLHKYNLNSLLVVCNAFFRVLCYFRVYFAAYGVLILFLRFLYVFLINISRFFFYFPMLIWFSASSFIVCVTLVCPDLPLRSIMIPVLGFFFPTLCCTLWHVINPTNMTRDCSQCSKGSSSYLLVQLEKFYKDF